MSAASALSAKRIASSKVSGRCKSTYYLTASFKPSKNSNIAAPSSKRFSSNSNYTRLNSFTYDYTLANCLKDFNFRLNFNSRSTSSNYINMCCSKSSNSSVLRSPELVFEKVLHHVRASPSNNDTTYLALALVSTKPESCKNYFTSKSQLFNLFGFPEKRGGGFFYTSFCSLVALEAAEVAVFIFVD